jgi:hypothetical protein
VQSAEALAIADAEIFAAHGGAFAVAGFTDADGTLRVQRDELRAPSSSCGIRSSRRRGSPSRRSLSELGRDAAPRLRAARNCAHSSGPPPVEGVQVLATRKHRLPPCRDFASPGAENPRVDQAVSDARGRFEIRGLDPDAPWTLSAAGAGFIGAERSEIGAETGTSSSQCFLCGVRVVFTGAEEPLPVDPDVMQNGGMSLRCLDSSVIDMNSSA